MTLLASPTSSTTETSDVADDHRVLLTGISWKTYSAMLNDIGDSALRLTYDNGSLEVELPGKRHEVIRKLCAAMIERALERTSVEFEPEGSTTWRHEAGLRGLEADECYHIQNFKSVAGRDELDLTIDPPPDLAVEVEIHSPLLSKMEVYRGLRVAELWRIRSDRSCEMYLLDPAGNYQPIQVSTSIPLFTPDIVSRYVRMRADLSQSETLKRFDLEVLTSI